MVVRTALALLLTTVLAAAVAVGTTGARPVPDERTRALRAAMSELVDLPQGPPGVIVLVQRDEEVRVLRAGEGNVRSHAAPHPGMHMRIASTAKAYNGAVVLSLVDHGVLSLDDRVGQWLRWAPRSWRGVTLGQLLHHTSGLPDFSADPQFLEHVVDNLEDPLPPSRLLRFVTDQPPAFRPGSRYRYSNTDNVVAALVAEAATGERYNRLLRELVYEPLDLEDTSLPGGVAVPRPTLRGYDREPDGSLVDVTELIAAGYAWASGGIVSTPRDQNRFIRGYVGRALFDHETQRDQFDWRRRSSSEPPGPGANAAGLALFRYRTGCGTVYGHTGNTPGYTQFMAASRDGARSVVVSVNRQTTPEIAPKVFRQLRAVFRLAVCSAEDR